MEKHTITNDFELDAIKDNFKPPMMTEMREDVVRHLFSELELSFDEFFDWIYKEREYFVEDGKKFYSTSDVATFINRNT